MPYCPLKDAAKDAPHLPAIISKDFTLTFSEFDQYVDQIQLKDHCTLLNQPPSIESIALFFAAWRKNKTIFSINPKLPQDKIEIKSLPPKSLLLFTSGSTAAPKIAVLSFKNLLFSAQTAISPLNLQPNDQWALTLPLYHVGGVGIILRCVLARATIVIGDSPNITHLSYIPTHLYRATPIYKNLKCLLLGGAAITQIPNNLPIYTTYGLTEMSSLVTLNNEILPGRELKIAPDNEILVKGPTLFQGYLGNKPPLDWFSTGDLGYLSNGKLTVTGRKDWMFISGGENIQPEEIEKFLLSYPNVLEAVIIPKNDPEFGKRPVAFLKTLGPINLKELKRTLLNHLPKYKLPVDYHIVSEIPKKNHFKINRFILFQLVNNQLDTKMTGQKNQAYL